MHARATLAFVVALAAANARAQQPDPPAPGTPTERAALAEALFEKAKTALKEHRYDEACPMLAESQRLDPGGGTLLALALCHERLGKTATAWSEMKDALARAIADGDGDRREVATRHIDQLEPKLSRLTVKVGEGAKDLAIACDGIPLGRPAWGLAAPMDPGDHRIEARAPGKVTWTGSAHLGPEGDSVVIDVPPLADVPAPPPKPAPKPTRSLPMTIGGASLAAAGATLLGVGLGYGARALGKQAEARAVCPDTACDDENALEANAAARSSAVIADVTVPVGVAAGAAGLALLLLAPRSGPPAPTSWRVEVVPLHGLLLGLGRAF